jgi:hypothetical protein
MDGPLSSYSDLAIHICWKVLRLARMEPPIQTEYLRSCRRKAETTTQQTAAAVSNSTSKDEDLYVSVAPAVLDMHDTTEPSSTLKTLYKVIY